MPTTKFDICNQALVSIGANVITAFDDSSEEATACGTLYQALVDNWLSMYPWRFATKEVVLSRSITAPTGQHWSAIYTQPGGMITLQAVEVGGRSIEFDRFENLIYCDAGSGDTVIGVYTYAISETYWPPYFIALMRLALVEALSFSLPSKLDLKDIAEKQMIQQYRMAKAADARQQTSRRLPVNGPNSIVSLRRT